MKAARPVPTDPSSSRRAQPVRQTRNNPPRSSGLLARSFSARDVSGGGQGHGQNLEQRTKIYPAITYFTDAITALPKELMRHLTLLKEVDAKIFTPEEALGHYIDAALSSPLPQPRLQPSHAPLAGPTSTPNTLPMTINGVSMDITSTHTTSATYAGDLHQEANMAWDPANVPRRQLFRQCAITMQEMLVSLDEKNHVISTATEALNRQLARLDDCFPYLEQEISEEARYGNDKHWAYTETRTSKPADKSRRDIGNQISNSHPISVDEVAARSESRKQAMLAKKGRIHTTESDFDEHIDNRHKSDPSKKPHGNSKKARPAELTPNLLSVPNGASINGIPPPKRRKVEKTVIGGTGMERSMSSVFGSNGIASKSKISSPNETPAPEGPKRKSKSGAATNGHSRKRTATTIPNAMSPSIASSPIHNTFVESKTQGRTSPVPTSNNRPAAARVRQNSAQSLVENARARPSSSSSNKPNGTSIGTPDLGIVAGVTGRSIPEVKAMMKESAANSKGEHLIEDANEENPDMRGGLVVGSRKDSIMKREESEANGTIVPPTVTTTIVTTKSGRASKPSTPALQSFPMEPVRSRSSRSVLEQTGTNAKRSHKKGAGQAAMLMAAQQQQQHQQQHNAAGAGGDEASKGAGMGSATQAGIASDEEDVEIDADEPTYCYCNGVSYGEMVACDAEGCAKEWFHLDCVGLKVAPKGNAKWYCDDCKENMKNNSKRSNGR